MMMAVDREVGRAEGAGEDLICGPWSGVVRFYARHNASGISLNSIDKLDESTIIP